MTDNGLAIAPWSGRRRAEALERVKAIGRRNNTPCCICGMPINYSLDSNLDDGCTVQHIKSRKNYPQLTWDPANMQPAHRACNLSAGADNGITGLGLTSQ